MRISLEEHKRAWLKQKVKTRSDSRGLSFSHYVAATTLDSTATTDCMLRQIPYKKGFAPLMWQQITDFQLLKKAGRYDIKLMRTIQLFMAEFNLNNKKLGRNVMHGAEKIGYFPEELAGSRKQRTAALTMLNKVLLNDIW